MAEQPMKELRNRLPQVFIQPKGLLATEACITIPFGCCHPIAIHSHFFEFIDVNGRCHRAHELRINESYEVVVTTGGGLWRYRLGDHVQVTGFVGKTPSLRFLGRVGNVSDLFGEKLSEVFVAEVIRDLTNSVAPEPKFAMLAPHRLPNGWCYRLYWEGTVPARASQLLEFMLLRNPQYGICRQLGQLEAARVHPVGPGSHERYVTRLVSQGMRLGDIKPMALSKLDSWAEVFPG
jgi:hypothetical protein